MTKFEEELSNLKVSKSENDTEYYNKVQLLTVFKDWQPQQKLPVVPEYVAEWYESHGESSESLEFYIYLFCVKFYSSRDSRKNRELTNFEKWFGEDKNKPIETLIRMQDGYTVEKPQLFYLKNKLTGAYLYYDEATNLYSDSDIVGYLEIYYEAKTKFTQQEIDSMQTGSYEQIEVAE